MSNFSYTFAGTGKQMRVEFKSVDTDGIGGLLDNIKITSAKVNTVGGTKVDYTLVDNDGDTSSHAYTLNQAPVFVTLDATTSVSEDGLLNGVIDSGLQNIIAAGAMGISDPDSNLTSVTLTAPTTTYKSGGTAITWTGSDTGTLIGSANGKEVIRVTIDTKGSYTVKLSGPIDHTGAGEDTLAMKFGVNAKDANITTTGSLTVNVADDSPVGITKTLAASATLVSGALTDGGGGLALTLWPRLLSEFINRL